MDVAFGDVEGKAALGREIEVLKLQLIERDQLLSKMTGLMRHYRAKCEGDATAVGNQGDAQVHSRDTVLC